MLRFSDYAQKITKSLHYHIENNIPLANNIYRIHSEEFYALFREARDLFKEGLLEVDSAWDRELLSTDIGEFGIYEEQSVPLDIPIAEEEKNPPLNKPKRGGPKKFYVYVRDPKTKRIKKVTFGAAGGGQSLKVKLRDKKARNAFSKRHRCPEKKDRTKASYWSCNLPRYASMLGLGANMNTFW